MPSFVFVSTLCRVGQTTDAVICDPTAAGGPDRKTSVPVKIRLASDQLLYVDDEPRSVVQTIGVNGKTTFLITGSSAGLRNRDRRVAVAQIVAQLDKLPDNLLPLKDQSKDPSLVVEGLGLLYQWTRCERERLQEKSKQLIEGRDEHDQ